MKATSQPRLRSVLKNIRRPSDEWHNISQHSSLPTRSLVAKDARKEQGSNTIADEPEPFSTLVSTIRACRICRDQPSYGLPLDHEPRPILQASEGARICIASQAPGIRAHESGRPFDDPSGVRLRQWLGMNEEEFYNPSMVAIVPMSFCFPGLSPTGGDLPPRRECAEVWRGKLFARLPTLALLLVVGGYAHRWHFGSTFAGKGVNETVRAWRQIYRADPSLLRLPLPHPSWHNNRWLKQNPWFENELLPTLRTDIRALLP
ncbi:uracil-DNA glycosylase family protein [Mesorhizobium sp.]|uniref:uracil-DNA glycosylase family protein n=1 Tax=Mesorhizobium sp. TaxID=1871066 RepID=UPI000FE986D3|nr:MAG: uracil-DNA glycosylase family protein [Mesorhizobium sp.]